MTTPALTVGSRVREVVDAALAKVRAAEAAAQHPAPATVCEARKKPTDSFERHPNGVPVLRPVIGDALRPAIADINGKLADQCLKNGDYEGAKTFAAKLKKCPTRDLEVNLSGNQTDPMVDTPGDGRTMINRDRFKSTYGELGDKKIAQAEQLQDMEKLCGRKLDPHNVKDMQAYFQKYSDKNPGKAGVANVRDEYARYLRNFAVHPGGGVQYSKDIPMDDRPRRMNEILANQPSDKAGRKMLDCKGYTLMNEAILGSIKDGNKPRFDVVHAGNEKHVVSGIFDRQSGEAFVMNNDRPDPVETRLIREHPARADELRVRVMKHWAPPAGDDPTQPSEPMSVAGRKPSDSIHPAAKPNVN